MKKERQNIFLVLMVFACVMAGCSGWLGTARYPDLRKVEREATAANYNTLQLPEEKPFHPDTDEVKMKSQFPEVKQMLAVRIRPDEGIKSVSPARLVLKTLWKHKGFPLIKRMKQMIGPSQTPPYGLIVFLIVVMSLCLGYGIVYLAISSGGGPQGCLIALFALAVVCGILIVVLLKQ